jgi:hypothetical protein
MKILENETNLTTQQIEAALWHVVPQTNAEWFLDQMMKDECECVFELGDRIPGSVRLHTTEEVQRLTVKWVHLLDADEDWYDEEEGVPRFRYLVLEVPREAPLFSWAAAAATSLLALDADANATVGSWAQRRRDGEV